jgi:hypothetical protein
MAGESSHLSRYTTATPHLDKLKAASANPILADDRLLLNEARELYGAWLAGVSALTSEGEQRVQDMVRLLNEYKDALEVELVLKRGSAALKRQRGQLKLDKSFLEDFLIYLVNPAVLHCLDTTRFVTGPQANAFMSLSFVPRTFRSLGERPEPVVKVKAQDFVLGGEIHYQFSSDAAFSATRTKRGSFVLAAFATECKINLDKTMFQEASGTAARLKMGCPVAKYFLVAEFLDMLPEDPRLTEIDNVFILRRATRLPAHRRGKAIEVEAYRKLHPIDPAVVWNFVEELQSFISTALYDPSSVLTKGSFV